MRVLVCAAEAPLPPINGFRLQLIRLCHHLAEHGEVHVIAYRWPEQQGRDGPPGVGLRTLTPPRLTPARKATAGARWLAGRDPLPVRTLTAPMAEAVGAELARNPYDVAYVTGSGLARVAPALGDVPAVLGALDAWHLNKRAAAADARGVMRLLRRLEERKVRRFGAHAYRPFARVVMVSEADADAARELDPTLAVEVIPNGVDAEAFSPGGPDDPEPGLIVFTGAMQWAPNAQAAEFLVRRVLPLVREVRAEARVALVGRNPGPPVLALGELDGVEVTGEVPDVLPWLRRADVFACLMRSGTGIKNKLLEALAAGAPCVATPLACQGIRAAHGEHLLIADGAESCAEALLRVMGDAELRRRLGAGGRRVVLEHHSWGAAGRAQLDLYRQVIEEHRQAL